MTRIYHKILSIARWAALVAVSIVIFVIAISYPIFSYIERDHALIEQRISDKINMPLHFKKLQAGWQRFKPGIVLDQIVIGDPAQPLFSAEAVYVQLDFIESLRTRSLVLGNVIIVGTSIPIKELPNEQFEILGFLVKPPSLQETAENEQNQALHKFLTQAISLSLRDSEIQFTRNTGKVFNIDVHRLSLWGGGENHTLEMVATWKEYNTAFNMSANLEGLLWQPERLLIAGRMRVEDLPWDASFPHVEWRGLSPAQGEIDLDAEYQWNAGVLESLHTSSHIRHLKLVGKNKILEPINFSGELSWVEGENDAWELMGHNVRLQIQHYDEVLTGNFHVRRTQENVIEAEAKTLPLDDIAILLSYTNILPQNQQEIIATLQPVGVLREVNVRWRDEKDWNAEAEFQISHKAFDAIPAVSHLQGTLIADPTQAEIIVDSPALQVDFKDKFPQPLFFTQSQGNILWQATENGWQLHAGELKLENDKIALAGEFSLQSVNSDPLYFTLEAASMKPVSAAVAKQYLPIGFLSPPLAEWLQNSIAGVGDVTEASMKIQGPLDEFPMFDNYKNGIFELQIGIENFTLQYLPDWPAATKLRTQMVMRERDIKFVVENAVVQDIPVKNVTAGITLPLNEAPRLKIDGQANATAEKGYAFLQSSPLWATLSPALGGLTIQGPVDLGISLDIPLGDSAQPLSIFGTVDMHDGLVHANEWDLDFTQVNGVLQFTEKSPSTNAQGITGLILGKPATLMITPPAVGKKDGTKWQLSTEISVALLQERFPNSAWKFVSGSTPINAAWFTGGDNAKSGLSINVISDLKGIGLQLPPPFTKHESESRSFQYTFIRDQSNVRKMHFLYGNILDAKLGFTSGNQAHILKQGDITIGHLGGNKSQPRIRISLEEWQNFFNNMMSPTTTSTDAASKANTKRKDSNMTLLTGIQKFNLYADELIFGDYTLANTRYILMQDLENWLFEIQGDAWRGRTTIPKNNQNTILMRFSHCGWQTSAKGDKSKQYDFKPQNIQAFDFACDNFIYSGRNLGKVVVSAIPKDDKLNIKNLSVRNNQDVLEATGVWEQDKNTQRTTFTGGVDSQQLDKTLHTLGINSGIKQSQAHIRYDLSWPNMPFAFDVAQLDGYLDILIRKGYIVGVEPGFGRVLGLLNVQNIERRLKLDFSDVFKDGYSFDKIAGEVRIRRGLAYFQNMQINSPSSVVNLQGGTNLDDKSLDLVLTVTAQISAGLPVAAGLAAVNPVVGAVTAGIWAASKVINAPLGGLVSYHYHVTGTWDKPTMTELKNKDAVDALLKNIQTRYGATS